VIRTNLFKNPNTQQITVYDLSYAAGCKLKLPGTSYEIFSFWVTVRMVPPAPIPACGKPVATSKAGLPLEIEPLPLPQQLYWKCGGPSKACMFLDGDSGYAGTRNNIPIRLTTTGGWRNVSFCDGHAEFVSARPESKYIQMIYLATDADP